MNHKKPHPGTNKLDKKYLIAALIWMAMIFIVSGIPSEQIPKAGTWDLFVKKGSHMAAYALLAVLWVRTLGETHSSWLVAWIIAILYALSDEYHQTFVPGRNGAFLDVLVDTVGATIGLAIWRKWVRRQINKDTID